MTDRERVEAAEAKLDREPLVGEADAMALLWDAEETLMEAIYNPHLGFECRRIFAFRALSILEKFRAHERLYRRSPEGYDGET